MTIDPATRLNSVQEYYFSAKLRQIAELRAAGTDIINLGIGSPDLPPHPSVIEALHEWALKPDAHGYQGYNGRPELRKAFAEWYQKYFKVSLDSNKEILPLIGSKEGIMHISMAFINPGDKVLIPDPGYPTYTAATNLAGGIPVIYDLLPSRNWAIDMKALAKFEKNEIKMMWINYPHMPTGKPADLILMRELVHWAKERSILLCNDNPYSFILNKYPVSILSLEGAKNHVIELNSMSKAQNMAGWRVGMAASGPAIIENILRFKSNMDSGMFLPIQMAAVKALKLGDEWYDQLNQVYLERRKIALQILTSLGCHSDAAQQGMFIWAAIPFDFENGFVLSDLILDQTGVFITPGGIFGNNGKKYLRISLCSKEEVLQKALDRIETNFIGSKKMPL